MCVCVCHGDRRISCTEERNMRQELGIIFGYGISHFCLPDSWIIPLGHYAVRVSVSPQVFGIKECEDLRSESHKTVTSRDVRHCFISFCKVPSSNSLLYGFCDQIFIHFHANKDKLLYIYYYIPHTNLFHIQI